MGRRCLGEVEKSVFGEQQALSQVKHLRAERCTKRFWTDAACRSLYTIESGGTALVNRGYRHLVIFPLFLHRTIIRQT
jgi:sirohydrochlorin ferrochelatase